MRIFQKQVKQLSDEELMKLLSKGNQKAFDEIYLRYSDVLFGYFMKMLARDKEKCEDMVHDLLRKSLENLIISMSIGHLELGYFLWHVTCVKMNTKGCLYENMFQMTLSQLNHYRRNQTP